MKKYIAYVSKLIVITVFLITVISCSPPKAVEVMVFLDISSSFNNSKEDAIREINLLSRKLDTPDLDKISLYVFDYTGVVQLNDSGVKSNLAKLINEYGKTDNKKGVGTPYGSVLLTIQDYIKKNYTKGNQLSILILGDGYDESVKNNKQSPDKNLKNISDALVSNLVSEMKKEAVKPVLGTLFLEPKNRYKILQLQTYLKNDLITSLEVEEKSTSVGLRRFIQKINR